MADFLFRPIDFRCFSGSSDFISLDCPTSVLIGRNNSGKSAFIDLVEVCTGISPSSGGQVDQAMKTEFHTVLDERCFGGFRSGTSGGSISGDHAQFAQRVLRGLDLTWSIEVDHQKQLSIAIHEQIERPNGFHGSWGVQTQNDIKQYLVRGLGNPLYGAKVIRVAADRDIRAESETENLSLRPDGSGATAAIHGKLNYDEEDESEIEVTLLDRLNEVFAPEFRFNRISTQKLGNDTWEIFLHEDDKGRIALSRSGSGLKTVILSLLTLTIHMDGSEKNQLFFFEELENNLHPAILRRLATTLADTVVASGGRIWFSTHSPTLIDLFSGRDDAQTVHVVNDQGVASLKLAISQQHRFDVFDSLDVRASDLLQANTVLWVEGPSDRILICRWIELLTNGSCREGTHFQCVFYGGRLLSHLKASDESGQDAVEILRLSRNAVVVIDSDKRKERQHLNKTKQRIRTEVTEAGGLAWITQGREIENYISQECVRRAFSSSAYNSPADKYSDFFLSLDSTGDGMAKKWRQKKLELAAQIADSAIESDLDCLDLRQRLAEVVRLIGKANGREFL